MRGRRVVLTDEIHDTVLKVLRGGGDFAIAARQASISYESLLRLRKRHKQFYKECEEACAVCDDMVQSQLFKNAMNGDTGSAIFWLKNRRRDKWRDVQRTEVTGADGAPLVDADGLAKIAAAILEK